MKKDPVCKIEVEGNEYQTYYRGNNFCFCSEACQQTFEKDPDSYVVIDDGEMPA
jgi:YHS domain-containing protein